MRQTFAKTQVLRHDISVNSELTFRIRLRRDIIAKIFTTQTLQRHTLHSYKCHIKRLLNVGQHQLTVTNFCSLRANKQSTLQPVCTCTFNRIWYCSCVNSHENEPRWDTEARVSRQNTCLQNPSLAIKRVYCDFDADFKPKSTTELRLCAETRVIPNENWV